MGGRARGGRAQVPEPLPKAGEEEMSLAEPSSGSALMPPRPGQIHPWLEAFRLLGLLQSTHTLLLLLLWGLQPGPTVPAAPVPPGCEWAQPGLLWAHQLW